MGTLPVLTQERARMPARSRRFIRRSGLARYLLVLPAFLFMLIFFTYPVVDNIIISFQDVNINTFVNGNAPWVGLANYSNVIQSVAFQDAVRNTLTFTVVCLVFQFAFGMLLALFLHRAFPLAGTIRALMLLPWLLPFVVTATAFKWLFTDPNGFVNYLLADVLHILPHHEAWLADTRFALPVAIILVIWVGVPFMTILLHSGLQGIPQEIYEAASIDGAGRWVRFWRITLPLLRPVIAVLLMLGWIGTIKVFDAVYVLTQGGPADATEMFSILSYQLSFGDFKFGEGAAVGNIMVLVSLVCAAGYLFTMHHE